jgi:hypothetical protein
VTLSDGRELNYDIYGDPEGAPVIFSHGFSDSHVIRHPDDSLTASATGSSRIVRRDPKPIDPLLPRSCRSSSWRRLPAPRRR